MNSRTFSPGRFWAVVAKEFIQMRRDRVTLMMMLGIPLTQLILFGYAINSDPRLPTAILSGDNSVFSRSIVSAMQTSSYFDVVREISTRSEAGEMLRKGLAEGSQRTPFSSGPHGFPCGHPRPPPVQP